MKTTKYKNKDTGKIGTISTKQFETGLFIYFPDGTTAASFKKEEDYHNELRVKLIDEGHEIIKEK